jgi:hypothetical protein
MRDALRQRFGLLVVRGLDAGVAQPDQHALPVIRDALVERLRPERPREITRELQEATGLVARKTRARGCHRQRGAAPSRMTIDSRGEFIPSNVGYDGPMSGGRRLVLRLSWVTGVLFSIAACSLTDLSGLSGGAEADGGNGNGNGSDARANDAGDAGASGKDAAPCTVLSNGKSCTSDSDCCSRNCYASTCESRRNGAGCLQNANCDSNKCYASSCTGTGPGADCANDDQCDSHNCYASFCEGNGPGASCTKPSNCTSGFCTASECQ